MMKMTENCEKLIKKDTLNSYKYNMTDLLGMTDFLQFTIFVGISVKARMV